MPHTKSAKKNLRKSIKRRMHNRAVKRDLKLGIKDFDEALESGTPEQLGVAHKAIVKKLDKASARGIIHANTAARKKSQLAIIVNKKKAAPPPATPPQS